MLQSQKLQLRLSEQRQALNELVAKLDAAETEERAALTGQIDGATKELASTEVEFRAAVTDEAAADVRDLPRDAEDRELARIEERAAIVNYLDAAAEGRVIEGAERELNDALKLKGGQFPLRLLAPSGDGRIEERASTDTDIVTRPMRWIDRLFAGTGAQRLGLTFDTVPSGEQSYPVTTAGGTPAQRGRSEAIADGAWTIGVSTLKPTRQGIRYVYNIEDAARVPGLESALERDLRAALRERVDHTIFAGDSGANENTADISGFFDLVTGGNAKTITQSNKTKPAETLQAFLALVDGLHAETMGDLNVVASVGANTLWGGTIANAAADNQTLAAFLRANGMSWTVRAGIADATTNNSKMAAIGLARGQEGTGVVATWEGATLVRDVYTGASKGEVSLTLNTLWNWGLARSSNYAKLTAVT